MTNLSEHGNVHEASPAALVCSHLSAAASHQVVVPAHHVQPPGHQQTASNFSRFPEQAPGTSTVAVLLVVVLAAAAVVGYSCQTVATLG